MKIVLLAVKASWERIGKYRNVSSFALAIPSGAGRGWIISGVYTKVNVAFHKLVEPGLTVIKQRYSPSVQILGMMHPSGAR